MSTNQTETTDTKEITLVEIHALRDTLKKYSTGWAKKMAAKLYPDEEVSVGRERVYNIISGSSRSGEVRNNFVAKAQELINEFKEAAINSRKTITDIVHQ